MLTKEILFCITILFSHLGFAQISEKLVYNPYAKSHTFFDSGSHKISDKNNAFCRGAGINLFYTAKPKIRLSFGYGLSVIDGLRYQEEATSNAAFHQVDFNAIYSIAEGRRIQPLLFLGYSFNYIPQLKDLDAKTMSTNLNLGYGIDLKLNKYLSAIYSNTYGVSLSEDFRYNFRHQLGVAFKFSEYQSEATKLELTQYESRVAYDLGLIGDLETKIDSLEQISNQVTSKTVENYKLKEQVTSLKMESAKLLKENILLFEEKQSLSNELSTYKFFTDSVSVMRLSDFYMLDSIGNISESLSQDFLGKWYAAVTNYVVYTDAVNMLPTVEQNGLESPFIVYHGGYYTILSSITDKKEKVISSWTQITNKASNYKLYQF